MKQYVKTFEGLFSRKPKDTWLESEPVTLSEIMDKFGKLTRNYPFISLLENLNNVYANKKVKLVASTGKDNTFDVREITITLQMVNDVPDYNITFRCYGLNVKVNDPDVKLSYFYKETPKELKEVDPFNEEDWT